MLVCSCSMFDCAVFYVPLQGLGYFLNLFSLSIPIPMCVSQTLPAHIVALLGYIPPLLILGTVIVYIIWWGMHFTRHVQGETWCSCVHYVYRSTVHQLKNNTIITLPAVKPTYKHVCCSVMLASIMLASIPTPPPLVHATSVPSAPAVPSMVCWGHCLR